MGGQRKIKCCEVTLKYLRYCLIFPKDGNEHFLEYNLRILCVFSVFFLLVLGDFSHFINAVKNHYDNSIINFDIAVFISNMGVIWINVFFYKNRHIIIELVRSISDFKLFEKPPAYEEFNKKLNFYAKFHLAYVISGAVMYFALFAPLHALKCKELNAQKNLTEICLLFSPVYVPYLQQKIFSTFPAVVYILTTVEFLIVVTVYTTCGSILWLNVECVEHISLKMAHLKSRLLIAFREKDEVQRRVLFREAIKYHTDILRMGHLADKFFGTELILHVILTGAILGCCAFVMLETRNLDTLMLFVGWLNAIIMGCVSGQRLINESQALPDILNEVNWQNLDISLKKDIVFFLLRCKNPMHIKAANVIMKNHLIIEILQTAYSYLTLLSSVNKEE
nr:odorant receptor 9 [Pachyrhinus yasumatsui]